MFKHVKGLKGENVRDVRGRGCNSELSTELERYNELTRRETLPKKVARLTRGFKPPSEHSRT
jgi:hypothetical protein